MHGHSTKVASLAVTIGEALGWAANKLAALDLGGLLHDIGKLAVSSHVLGKPGPLAPDELAVVRSHPVTGAKLLEQFADARPALACVLFHHERWDGDGYPTGRAGHDVPLDARVLAIADAYDAMTTARPYRRALTGIYSRLAATLKELTGGDAARHVTHHLPGIRRAAAPMGSGLRPPWQAGRLR